MTISGLSPTSLGDAPSTLPRVAPGTVIAERYRVNALLGEGGMGTVYLAEHVYMRKRFALKVLLPQWTSMPEAVARFEQEAVAAGTIAHPNVAAATDFGRLPNGSFFLVLEYLEGRTLRTELERGPIAPERALRIAHGMALGIAAAHAKGIVHRDLKPENVMLVARDGDPDFVKVLDFGIARLADRSATSGPALTSAGAVLGTPEYMAPEQALGEPIDARTDLYALGVVLFEMLTGQCPFQGGAITLLRDRVTTPAPPLPRPLVDRVPPQVQSVVARLLETEPAARYASALELLPALEACIAARMPARQAPVVVARPATLALRAAGTSVAQVASSLRAHALAGLSRAVVAARRRPRAAMGVGAGLTVLALIAVTWSATGTAPRPPTTSTREHTAPALALPTAAPPESRTTKAIGRSTVSCLDAKFADHIEGGQPVGDAQGIAAARRAIYWVDIANAGRPTRIVLVWTLDGREVQRQSLGVGQAPHWRTWGSRAVGDARQVGVQVLDGDGNMLKEDTLDLER